MEDIVELQIVQEYKNGETLKNLARKYHVGFYKITDVLDKYNIPHNRKTKKEAKRQEFLAKSDEVIQFYLEGNGLNKCAKKFHVYSRDIKKLLQENNIHIRSYQEVLTARERDEDFFKKQTHEMAWLVGFLASDGSISQKGNGITIQLSKKDEEILQKIRFLLGIDNSITYYTTNTGFDVASYRWSSKTHKADLAEYGVIPNKTFALKPPYKLETGYYLDYIRGYFDGDGSINLIKNGNGRGKGNLRWQVCSATPEILEFILETFEKKGIPRVNIQKWQRVHPLYVISYSSSSTRKIYDILYNESYMFLQRKKDHYEEILSEVDAL
jgi:hypothetical protein